MFVNGDLKGKFIMDRNLGARDPNFASDGTGCLYYIYGRKDPFAGSISGGTGQTVAYNRRGEQGDDDIWNISNGAIPTTVYSTVNNPMIWYGHNTQNWTSDVDSEVYVWNDFETDKDNYDKSIFDPSPKGWKVAAHGTWAGFSLSTMTDGATSGNYGRSYPRETPFAYYPAHGYRTNATGGVAYWTTYGYSWSSTPSNATYSYRFFFGVSVQSIQPSASIGRGSGQSLRLVQHDE